MIGIKKLIGVLLVFAVPCGAIRAQSVEEATVEAAGEVLREIMAIPAKCIPHSLLADAQGVAIIPGMIKGGFVVGVRHGKGVIVSRSAAGEWVTLPAFVTVTGGSVGLQAGLQATDVIAVFRTRQSVDKLMRGKFTIGADLSVAAGPVGREASAATDVQLKAEILSYSRSRGLFAGVSIDGAVMQIDHKATALYYAPRAGQPRVPVPASGIKLVEHIVSYAEAKKKPVVFLKEAPAIPAPPDDAEAIRVQLAESSVRLHKVLDPQWRDFLALPAEVYAEGKTPSREAVAKCLERYNVVTSDARYQALSSHAEFRETHALLLRYRSAVEGHQPGALKLPPPPN